MVDPVPSTPDPQLVALVLGVLRAFLPLLAALGVHVTTNDANLTILSGVIVGAGTAVWSIWQKYQDQRRDHAGSVASAEAHVPLRVN
jgi:ABC-type nickel/cobalt efflux system permease component RcnA